MHSFMNTIMRIIQVLLILFTVINVQGQIVQGVTYTEDEIAVQDKFVEAKKYTLIGRFEKAEEILKQLYNDDRTNAAISTELSKVYGYLEDPYNELRYAKTAYENDPNNEYVKINFSNICFNQERYDEAIPPLKNLVSAYPSSEAYTDKLATAYLQINNSDEAIQAYNALESRIGITENVSRRKFEIYEILGKNKKAVQELVALSSTYPNDIRFKHNLASYHTKMGKEDKALLIYKEILELDINDAAANMAITSASSNKGDDNTYLRSLTPIIENKSIPVDRKVLELVPYVEQLNTTYDQELADALIMISDKIAIAHPDDAKTHAIKGDILLAANRSKDAAKAYEKTLSINDKNFLVWEGLMEAYSTAQDNKNLLRVSTEALDLYPNKASGYMYYGRANTLTKNFSEAIDLLEEGVFVSGKDVYHKSNMLAELARAYTYQKKYDDADHKVAEALEMSQNKNPLALEIYGDLLYQKGDTQGAIKQWKNAQNAGSRSSILKKKIEDKKL